MSSTLDYVQMNMSPCTTLFARGMDSLKEKPVAFLSTRIVGPLAAFPLLADAALHVSASVVKALYCLATGSVEIVINAFRSNWKVVNPLDTKTWNRWQSTRHLVKAAYCLGAGLLSIPLGLTAPSLELKTVRYLNLAKPETVKKKDADNKSSPVKDAAKQVWQTVADIALFPFDAGQALLQRFPLLFNMTKWAVFALTVGVGVHYAPAIINTLGLNALYQQPVNT